MNIDINLLSGEYRWTTDYEHPDNIFTLTEYLENYLPEGFNITYKDGNIAGVQDIDNNNFTIMAKGDGDFYNHIVCWELFIFIKVNID